jgi:hypothetical protein
MTEGRRFRYHCSGVRSRLLNGKNWSGYVAYASSEPLKASLTIEGCGRLGTAVHSDTGSKQ